MPNKKVMRRGWRLWHGAGGLEVSRRRVLRGTIGFLCWQKSILCVFHSGGRGRKGLGQDRGGASHPEDQLQLFPVMAVPCCATARCIGQPQGDGTSPVPQALSPAAGFCTHSDLGASFPGGSVHAKVLVDPLKRLLCTSRY